MPTLTLRGARGFTLIEMTVSITILGALVVALSMMMVEMYQSYSGQQQFADQDAQARLAMERIVRDLRDARSRADLGAAGASLTFTDVNNAAITYALSGTLLQRNGVTIADRISNLSFAYYDNAGAATVAAGARYVVVQFRLTTQDNIARDVRSAVFPRNFS